MLRTVVLMSLMLPVVANAQFAPPGAANGTNSTNAGTRGLFGRRANVVQPAEIESKQVAQPANRNQPGTQYPQLQVTPAGGLVPAAQAVRETPRPVRRTAKKATPKPETDSESSESSKKSDATDSDSEKKSKKADSPKVDPKQAELTKSADAATTIVFGFLKNANEGVYSEAVKYLTPELQKYFDSEISVVNGSIKQVLDKLTHSGGIRGVDITNATVRGEGVIVETSINFQAGSPEARSFDLIKTKVGWKIVLPVAAQREPVSQAIAGPSSPSTGIAASDGRNEAGSGQAASVSPAVSVTPAPPAATPMSTPAPPSDSNTTPGSADAKRSAPGTAASGAGVVAALDADGIEAGSTSVLADAPWRKAN